MPRGRGPKAVENLDAQFALFERLPIAARYVLADILAAIGIKGQAYQRQLAPQGETGRLRRGIEWEAVAAALRVRIGLLRLGTGDAPYYGRFVHFGRAAQTVLVQRRRRVNGRLRTRGRRKIAEDIVATYKLRVRARAATPFVVLDGRMEGIIDAQLAQFWPKALDRVDQGAIA